MLLLFLKLSVTNWNIENQNDFTEINVNAAGFNYIFPIGF